MGLNQNSGYGQHLSATLHNMAGAGGKVFMVAKSAAAGRQMLQDLFNVDPDGVNRFAATVDAAMGYCTASRGDVILVAPGHTESLKTAAAIAQDVAGVSVIGLGVGNNRPVFTFDSTDNSATWAISGNNCALKNVVLVCGDDALTNALVVTGDNCDIDIEFQDTSSAIEAATAVRLDTANNCNLKLKHIGFTAGNAVTSLVKIDDCDNVRIDIDAYGVCSTAWVDMVDAASTNVFVAGQLYTQGITNFSRNVVDTIGTSTWFALINDKSAGSYVMGSNVVAFADADVSSIAAAIAAIQADLGNPSARTNLQTIEAMLGNPDTAGKTIHAEINKIDSATLAVAPVANSLARFIASGGTALGTQLGASKSIIDALGHTGLAFVAGGLGSYLARCVEKSDGAVLLGNDALFTISGGPVEILSITGIVATAIGAGATNVKLQIVTTEPAATVDMNAGAVDIDADAAGTSYRTINTTGIFTPVTAGFVLKANSFATNDTPFLAPIGSIQLNSDAARDGVIKWYLVYRPLSSNSNVVAAA